MPEIHPDFRRWQATPVTVEEYKERLAARLVKEAPTIDNFRAKWVAPRERRALIGQMPDAGRSVLLEKRIVHFATDVKTPRVMTSR